MSDPRPWWSVLVDVLGSLVYSQYMLEPSGAGWYAYDPDQT